jgi:hypothetical protein
MAFKGKLPPLERNRCLEHGSHKRMRPERLERLAEIEKGTKRPAQRIGGKKNSINKSPIPSHLYSIQRDYFNGRRAELSRRIGAPMAHVKCHFEKLAAL